VADGADDDLLSISEAAGILGLSNHGAYHLADEIGFSKGDGAARCGRATSSRVT
jgi:hypothetical protein